jgi:hypothetical protein
MRYNYYLFIFKLWYILKKYAIKTSVTWSEYEVTAF